MTDFMKGLSILVWGWGASFVAMAVFMGLILLLRRIFPYKAEVEESEAEGEAETTLVLDTEAVSEDEEVVAAIAAAVGYLRAKSQTRLGGTLESGRGRWWVSNRLSTRETTPLRK